jgi:hypothetical protein
MPENRHDARKYRKQRTVPWVHITRSPLPLKGKKALAAAQNWERDNKISRQAQGEKSF